MGFIISGTVPTPQTHYFATLSAGGQSFSESASALDSSGNMYVAGSYQAQFQGDTYFMLVKFNSLGSLQWQKRLPVLNMSIRNIAVDSSGNVYASGSISASAQYSSNQLIIKFDSNGNYVWKKQFGQGNTEPGSSGVLQIAISSADDIYVAGSIKGGGTYGNLYSYISLVKYNTSGDVQWQRSLNQSGSQVNGNGVTIDSSGNIYVVGSGQWTGYNSYNNAIIAKYSSTGTLLWQQAVAGTSSVSMGFTKTACDSSGNVYAVATANFSSVSPKVIIVKYDTSGAVQWSRQWGTTGTNNQMSVGAIKIDGSDNLYISGSTYNSITSNFEDSIIAKYNSSGAIQWQRYINAPNMGSGPQLHVDNLNNFYIATDSNKNGNKWVVAKLPTDGSKTATYSPGGASYSLIYGTASLSETSFSTNVITPTLTNTTSTYPAGDATIGDMSTTTWSAAVVTSASAGDAGPFGTFMGGTGLGMVISSYVAPPPSGATTTKAIFGYGSGVSAYSLTNLVSNTGVVATDTAGVGTIRSQIAAAGYGSDKAIFGYGYTSSWVSITNLVSNTGVVAADTTGVGTARSTLAATGYGTDKAIFGYGSNGGGNTAITNLVSNAGVVATDTAGVGTVRSQLAATRYGEDKAIFGYGYIESSPYNVSITNLVSNTGVVASDTAGVGTIRLGLAATGYGTDKAIFGYGNGNKSMTNLVSNTGVVASDTTGVGTGRNGLAAATYGSDKAIFGYGYNSSLGVVSITNLVSNTGVVSSDTTGVGTARYTLGAAGYSQA